MRQFVLISPVFALGVALTLLLPGCVRGLQPAPGPLALAQSVGRVAGNRYQTPTGQLLTPAGLQIELPGMRPQALALSPDGTLLATAGMSNVMVLINPANGKLLQAEPLSTNKAGARPDSSEKATPKMSLTGLVFAPDGRRIYLSDTDGKVRVFPVDQLGRAGQPIVFPVPEANAPKQKHEIPAGLAVSADGRRLYVAGNLGNQLHEMDAASGAILRWWDTGVAPYDVALAGDKAYVSNLGGRRPAEGVTTGPAGKGTSVRVDPVRHIANEGSVTVVDLAAGKVKTEILVGLHASALAVSPGAKYVVVANSGSDTLSVIDTRTDRLVEKIWTRQTPADLFGAQPNALAFDSAGRRLYVCNGTQNAVAVIRFEPEANASKVVGLIPVGWFPGAIQYRCQAQDALCGQYQRHRRCQSVHAGRAGETQEQGFLRHGFPRSGADGGAVGRPDAERLAEHSLSQAGGGAPAASFRPAAPPRS